MKKIEDKIIGWLKGRQNRRRFDTKEVTYQDCMDMMFVLAQRLKEIEKRIHAQPNSQRNS